MAQKWFSCFQLKPGTYVFVPTDKTVEEGRALKKAIEERWQPPRNYYHLTPGGHLSALRAHIGNEYFVHLDIQGFFAAISKTRITRELKPLFGYEKARQYAIDSTVPIPHKRGTMLPFGFVQSPILASVCLSKSALGRRLGRVAREFGVVVSVYVDDIILSGNDIDALERAAAEIEAAAIRSNFPLNSEKREGPARQITAFNIQLSHQSLLVEPDRWREFVTMYVETENERVRGGIQGYVHTVNPNQATAFPET
jgi:hypothetical protein